MTYFERCQADRQKASTLDAKESLARLWVLPTLGEKNLRQCCDDEEIHHLKAALSGLGARRANCALTLLHHMLRTAPRRYDLRVPEIDKLRPQSVDRIKCYSARDATRIIGLVKPQYKAVVLLALDAGLRTGEVAALR